MFSCDSCKKRFFNKHDLNTHSKLLFGPCFSYYYKKDNISKYFCDFCSKGFTSNQDLVNHITTCNTTNNLKK